VHMTSESFPDRLLILSRLLVGAESLRVGATLIERGQIRQLSLLIRRQRRERWRPGHMPSDLAE